MFEKDEGTLVGTNPPSSITTRTTTTLCGQEERKNKRLPHGVKLVFKLAGVVLPRVKQLQVSVEFWGGSFFSSSLSLSFCLSFVHSATALRQITKT